MHPIGKKKKAHQLTEVERLKEEIRVLKTKTPEYKDLEERNHELKFVIESMKDRVKHCAEDAGRYRNLRRKELIIPDIEQGMIYATGEELDKLIDGASNTDVHSLLRQLIDAATLSSKPITAKPSKIFTTAGMINDAQKILNNSIREIYADVSDSFTYQTYSLGFVVDNGRK